MLAAAVVGRALPLRTPATAYWLPLRPAPPSVADLVVRVSRNVADLERQMSGRAVMLDRIGRQMHRTGRKLSNAAAEMARITGGAV